jgi:hypothetical protein
MTKAILAALALPAITAAAGHVQSASAEDLNSQLMHARAVQAAIWGMSAVN